MKNNLKNIIIIVIFATFLFGFTIANAITPDEEFSKSERRRLITFPEFTTKKLFNGKFFNEFEKYTLDQFVLRDTFRSIKAAGKYYLLLQKDNNDIYIIDGNINKIEYPLKEKSVLNAAKKLNEVYEKYLQGKNVYYSIIPDKNYFLAEQNGYLHIDYEKMIRIMNQNTDNLKYIDIFNSLSIDDYYFTDIHWSQDKIIQVADKLLNEMGNKALASDEEYIKKTLFPFHGSYYGQAALKVKPDTLVYLINDMLENAVVYDYHDKTEGKIYEPQSFEGMDPYDVYLSGAKPLLTISNPNNPDGKELIMFRDSFGSSIAPLLLNGYSKVTLVDLRYITTDLLGEYIDFTKEQDVLFLYNTMVLNNSSMLK